MHVYESIMNESTDNTKRDNKDGNGINNGENKTAVCTKKTR